MLLQVILITLVWPSNQSSIDYNSFELCSADSVSLKKETSISFGFTLIGMLVQCGSFWFYAKAHWHSYWKVAFFHSRKKSKGHPCMGMPKCKKLIAFTLTLALSISFKQHTNWKSLVRQLKWMTWKSTNATHELTAQQYRFHSKCSCCRSDVCFQKISIIITYKTWISMRGKRCIELLSRHTVHVYG